MRANQIKESFDALQQSFLTTLKEHRTVKILHLFRAYSAIAVVVCAVFLVSIHNVRSQRVQEDPFGDNSPETSFNRGDFYNTPDAHNGVSYMPYVKTVASAQTNQQDANSVDEINPPQVDAPAVSSFSFLNSQSIIASANAMEEDPQMGDGVKIVTVKEGDTVSDIAERNGVTANTILWANNIEDIDSIMPGDQIFVLPVAGLKYAVKEGDSLDSIAKEFKAERDQIIAFNDLPANGKLENNQEIIIPGGEKEVPQTTTQSSSSLIARKEYVVPSGGISVSNRHGRPNRFPYGYCTWYVAQKKFVPWGGNAGTWLYHAKSMGYSVGKKPQTGSIVVTTDNAYYGHVALVEKVSGDAITISEMNYKGWGKTNTRTIAINSRSIKGYIYSN